MRRINSDGVALIKQWEGLRLDAYKCSADKWTIGYGHTATAKEGMSISLNDAESLLYQDLALVEAAVSRAVEVKLSDNQFAALVSWTYNIGISAMRDSSLVRRLNQGDYGAVPGELARWSKVSGRANKGLSNRRAAEAGLWARGSFVASRDVEPTEPSSPSPASEASKLGGVAAAASTVAPLITGLSGVHWIVGVAVVAGVVALTAAWLFKKRDS